MGQKWKAGGSSTFWQGILHSVQECVCEMMKLCSLVAKTKEWPTSAAGYGESQIGYG